MNKPKSNWLWILLASSLSTSVNAEVIAVYDAAFYFTSGTVTNQYTSAITQITIDLVPDAGGNTPIWDTGSSGGSTFSNFGPGSSNDWAFTRTWFGLNVLPGGQFNHSFIDYDGFDSPGNFNGGGSTLMDGSEYMSLSFSDGTSVTSFFPAFNPGLGQFSLAFERSVPVPEPGTVGLLGVGLLGLGFMRRKRTA